MRLCFGTFAKVLKACRYDQGVTDKQLVGELIKSIDPDSEYSQSSDSSISRLLSCDQNLSSGQKRRVGNKKSSNGNDYDQGYVTNRLSDAIDKAKNIDKFTVASYINENVIRLIDADRINLIIPALLDIVDKDEIIDKEKSNSFKKYVGCTKKELLSQTTFEISGFLAGLLLYVVIAVVNTDGKPYAKSVNKSYVNKFQSIASKYHIEDGSALYSNKNRIIEGKKIDDVSVDLEEQELIEATNKSIDLYLKKISEKYSKVYTIIYNFDPVDFYNVFICNDIERRLYFSGSEQKSYKSTKLPKSNVQSIVERSKYSIITGTGGIGKSMMMRHLMFDAISQYPTNGTIPVFIELKDFLVSDRPLSELIKEHILHFGTGMTEDMIDSLLSAGRFLFLFDGLDEVKSNYDEGFRIQLDQFIDRFSDNSIIISSRPYRSFTTFFRFLPLFIRPFNKKQALSLIEKLEYRTDTPSIKDCFYNELKERLFDSHRQFASNPLLLTIMLMTHGRYGSVPGKRIAFYRKAYDVLAQEHDATKGVTRPYATQLSADDFESYLLEFCARSYIKNYYDFTEEQFEEVFNELNVRKNSPNKVNAKDFRDDLVHSICLMYYDGKYQFIHRSFQEYFCAKYFSKQKDKHLYKIAMLFENMPNRDYTDKTFDMLYEMCPERLKEFVFLPFLEDYFSKIDEEYGYRTFLEWEYNFIHYDEGEVGNISFLLPNSFLYRFIAKSQGIRVGDINEKQMPKGSHFVYKEWVCLEDDDFVNTETYPYGVIERKDVPEEYIDKHGEPTIVGRTYGLMVDIVYQEPQKYDYVIDILESDDFPIKQEYNAMRRYLQSLIPRPNPDITDIFDEFL